MQAVLVRWPRHIFAGHCREITAFLEYLMRSLKRLLLPLVVFLAFLGIAYYMHGSLSSFRSEAFDQTQRIFSYILQVGIWLSAAYFLNRLVHVFIWDGIVSGVFSGATPRLLKDVVGFVIYMVAITGIVGFVFNRSVTGIWATSGAIGLILGFALRSIILDVFTGLAINIDRPYKIGDWIMVHGGRPELHIIGSVKEINWRTTRITTKDGNVLIVPNSMMGMTMITNFMVPDVHNRHEIFFTLDFSVPPDQVLRILNAATKAVCTEDGLKAPLLYPKPKIRIIRATPMGVEYRVRYWTIPKHVSPGKARHIVTKSILEHLQQAGLTLAYPKQDVYHEKMPVRQLNSQSVEDRMRLLSRIELFEKLSKEDLDLLATSMERRFFEEKEVLIKRGDSGDSMFILVEGLLEVFADIHGNGEEVKVAQMVPGHFFGEMSLLTGEPRSATIQASTDIIAYEITKENISILFGRRPEIAESISETVARRKMRDVEKRTDMTNEEKDEQASSFSTQMLSKMKSFFGVFGEK